MSYYYNRILKMRAVFYRNLKTRPNYWFAKRYLHVLGIESSCDDTSAAVVNDSKKILGEGHFSQAKLHVEAGGIIPILACNLHKRFIKDVVETSMKESLKSFSDLDAIAVTVKPGLILSLKAGVEYAKDLCTLYSKPLIPIHHMEAHALTAQLTDDVKFPFLTLLISGGHSLLAVAESVDKFKKFGESMDNSPGAILDRIARKAKLNNLKKFRGLVGGAAIEAAAQENGDSSKFNFPHHILHFQSKNCNFSFSPFLSQAQKFLLEEEKKHNLGPDEVIPNISDFCAATMLGITAHVCQRLEVAINYINMTEMMKENEKCLVMSGGVACNAFIRKAVKKVCNHYGYRFVVPPPKLCSDNGVMIAWNGIERLKGNLQVVQPDNLASVTELAKCPLGEDLSEDIKAKGKGMSFKYMKWKSYSEIAELDERSESDFCVKSATMS